MKKMILILIIIMLLAVPAAMADTSVNVSASTANPGDNVTIWGTTDAAQYIVVRVTDSAGNIVYFGGVEADAGGNYVTTYTVPSDMEAGDLQITAGSGSDTAVETINIVVPEPTPYVVVNPRTGIEADDAGANNYSWLAICTALLAVGISAVYMLKRKRALSSDK